VSRQARFLCTQAISRPPALVARISKGKGMEMKKLAFAVAMVFIMFSGIALQAGASASSTHVNVPQLVVEEGAAAEEGNHTSPGSEGGLVVALGGIIVVAGFLTAMLLMTLKKRKLKGI